VVNNVCIHNCSMDDVLFFEIAIYIYIYIYICLFQKTKRIYIYIYTYIYMPILLEWVLCEFMDYGE
jgi:hypothetical protein